MIVPLRLLYCAARASPLLRLWLSTLLCGAAASGAQDAPRRISFDLAAGLAPVTLRQFSSQSGSLLLYSVEEVRTARTQTVRGKMTAREALQRMLAGTRLLVTEDPVSGAFAIRGPPPPRNLGSSAPLPQEAPQPPPSTDRRDEAVLLPSFTVESGSETGYSASHSISATKMSTELRKMPLSIDIITEELFRDYGLSEVLDIIGLSSAVTFTQRATGSEPSESYSIRGFTTHRQARNGNMYFRTYDSANVSRVEIVNGPASVLYGQLDPGGIVNTITKQPSTRPETELRVELGSWDYRRIQIGTTGPLDRSKTLAFRVDASFLDREGSRDYDWQRKQFAAPSVRWQPSRRTSLTVDLEYCDMELSGTNFWPRYIDRAANVVKWADMIPRTFNSQVPGLGSRYENLSYTATLEHALGDRVLLRNVSGVSTQRYLGTSAGSVNVTPNARGQLPFARPFGGSRKSDRTFANTMNLASHQRFGPGHHARIVLGWDCNETRSDIETRRAGAGASGADPAPWDLAAPPSTWDKRVPDFAQARITAHGGQRTRDDKFYLVDALALFDERLMLLGGLNRSRVDVLVLDHRAGTRLRLLRSHTTPQAGALWQLAPQLGLYANYSESFLQLAALRTNRDRTLSPFDPLIARGLEAGAKCELLEGRIGGQVTVFNVTYLNARQQFREDSGFTYETQTGESESKGLEFRLSANPTRSLQVVGSYTYTDAQVTKNPAAPEIVGRPLPKAPRHSATMTASYRVHRGWLGGAAFGASIGYRGETRAFETTDPFFLDARLTLNVRASYTTRLAGKPLSFQLLVNNVGNAHYFANSSGPADPLSFRLSAERRF